MSLTQKDAANIRRRFSLQPTPTWCFLPFLQANKSLLVRSAMPWCWLSFAWMALLTITSCLQEIRRECEATNGKCSHLPSSAAWQRPKNSIRAEDRCHNLHWSCNRAKPSTTATSEVTLVHSATHWILPHRQHCSLCFSADKNFTQNYSNSCPHFNL